MNFGIGSAFSEGLGSAFSEGPGPGPGQDPLFKVCPVSLAQYASISLNIPKHLEKCLDIMF